MPDASIPNASKILPHGTTTQQIKKAAYRRGENNRVGFFTSSAEAFFRKHWSPDAATENEISSNFKLYI